MARGGSVPSLPPSLRSPLIAAFIPDGIPLGAAGRLCLGGEVARLRTPAGLHIVPVRVHRPGAPAARWGVMLQLQAGSESIKIARAPVSQSKTMSFMQNLLGEVGFERKLLEPHVNLSSYFQPVGQHRQPPRLVFAMEAASEEVFASPR